MQPVFVLDDGETLTERAAEPVVVSAAEWPSYATGRFAQVVDVLRQQVESTETNQP